MSDIASTPAMPPTATTSADPIDIQLATFKAQFPDSEVEIYTSEHAGQLILRTPSEADCTRFYAARGDSGRTVQTANALCLACILYPSTQEMVSVFKRKPLLGQPIATRLLAKAGIDEDIRLGK